MRFCPRCGREMSVAESLSAGLLGGWFSRLSWPLQTLIMLVLFGSVAMAIVGTVYRGDIEQMYSRKVEVRSGTIYRCSQCDRIYRREVKTLMVPVRERRKYRVVEKQGVCDECGNRRVRVTTGERIQCERCGAVLKDTVHTLTVRAADAKRYKLIEKSQGLCDACKRATDICRRHPDWDFDVCRDIADKRVRVGMTEMQVRLAWGDAAGVTTTQVGQQEEVRWTYGDPVYGVPVPNRFVVFREGRVTTFSGQEWIENEDGNAEEEPGTMRIIVSE